MSEYKVIDAGWDEYDVMDTDLELIIAECNDRANAELVCEALNSYCKYREDSILEDE